MNPSISLYFLYAVVRGSDHLKDIVHTNQFNQFTSLCWSGSEHQRSFLLRLTLVDVALEAGVSSATVDRVLHGRSGVKSRTRDAVLDAARRLGYIASDAASVPSPEIVQLDFVLPAGSNSFMRRLAAELRSQSAMRPDIDGRMHLVEGIQSAHIGRQA